MPQPKLLVSEDAATDAVKEGAAKGEAAARSLPEPKAAEPEARTGEAPRPALRPRPHNWPVWTALSLSVLWLLLGAVYVESLYDWKIADLPPHMMAGLIGGLFMPIAVFWFIALYVRRSEDLKHAARALERSLVSLSFPGEAGSERIDSVVRILSVHAQELRAAVDMAQKEAARIEDLFTQQTFRLAETTDMAGKRAHSVKELLATTHSEIDARITALETKAEELNSMLKARTETLGDSATGLAEKLLSVDGILETTIHNMASAGAAAGQRADAFSRQLHDGAGVLESALAEAEGIAGRIAQSLEGERKALVATSHKVQSEGTSLRATLKDEQAALLRAAEALAASSHEAHAAMLAQVSLLDGSAGKWNEAIGTASTAAAGHLESLKTAAGETIAAVSDAAEKARGILNGSGDDFDRQKARLIEAAETAAAALQERMGGLNIIAEEAEDHWRQAVNRTLEAMQAATGTLNAGTSEMVTAGDLAADKLESRMDRLKEGWTERLWELEKATTHSLEGARISSEALGKTAQDLEGHVAALVARLGEAKGVVDSEDGGIGQSVARIVSELQGATVAFAAEEDRLKDRVAEAHDGTAKLEALLASLSERFGTWLGDIETKTDSLGEKIAGHGGRLGDVSREAGERIAEAGQSFETLAGRMTENSDRLLQQLGRISEEASRAEERLSTAGQSSNAAAQSLSQALGEATARLGDLATALESKAELVHRLSGQSGEALETAGDALAGYAADIEGRVSKAAEALKSAGDLFDRTLGDGESRAEAAAKTLTDLTTDLNAKMAHLSDSMAEAKARIEDAAGSMDSGEDGVLRKFDEAARILGAAESQLREQAFDLIDMAERTAQRLAETTGSLNGQAETITAATMEAETAATRLGSHFAEELESLEKVLVRLTKDQQSFAKAIDDAADQGFVREAGQITQSLNSLAIDIDRVLEADLPDTAWQQYLKGDKSLFARRIVKLGSREARRRISEKYESDAEFQAHVDRFCKRFEALLRRAATSDRDGTVSVTLISSHMGRLYVLLGQSIKRLS
jgi:hypothetical protein